MLRVASPHGDILGDWIPVFESEGSPDAICHLHCQDSLSDNNLLVI